MQNQIYLIDHNLIKNADKFLDIFIILHYIQISGSRILSMCKTMPVLNQ